MVGRCSRRYPYKHGGTIAVAFFGVFNREQRLSIECHIASGLSRSRKTQLTMGHVPSCRRMAVALVRTAQFHPGELPAPRFFYSTLSRASLAGQRVNLATGLAWLRDRWISRTAAAGAFDFCPNLF
jgi:hypothetical protein